MERTSASFLKRRADLRSPRTQVNPSNRHEGHSEPLLPALQGHSTGSLFLKGKWEWVGSDSCWWCSKGRQSREHLFEECKEWRKEIYPCGKEWGASLGKGVCVRIRTEKKPVPSSSFSPFLLAFSRSLFLSLLPHVYVLVFGVHHRAQSVTGFGPCAAISPRPGCSMLDYKQKHLPDYATVAVKNSCTSPYTEA